MTTRAHTALAVAALVASLTGDATCSLAQSAPAPASAPPVTVPHAAQTPAAPSATPAARPEDVASADAVVKALYDVISGPAGVKRDWDRFRSLFVPGARLIPIVRREGTPAEARMLTPDDYVTRSSARLEQDGFSEREIARVVEAYGSMVHVFSTYEARRASDEGKPFMRGINSIQLLNDGTRWWIVTVYWQSESPDIPLPDKYLPRK